MTRIFTSDHPTPEQLRDFQLGKLDDDISTNIEDHLESCESCIDYLANLPQSDQLVALICDLEKTTHESGADSAGKYSQNTSRHGAPQNPAGAAPISQEDAATVRISAPMTLKRHSFADIPGYDLLEELGRGGMGVVYKARHQQLDRLVAVKLLFDESRSDREALQRLQKEAQLLALLKHPNIVQIYEVHFDHDPCFIALEYIPGGDLAKQLAAKPLMPQQAARLIEQLARAVQAAHDAKVIHRDLKPANVLFNREGGVPKITDFGLARRFETNDQLTQDGVVLGTPSYMAPEQANAQNKDISPLTDVYALGAILYECLTGRPPFKAADALVTMLNVVHDVPVPPSQLQPGLPRDLETICLKCLEKEPNRRYATADALADELARFLNGEPIAARPVSALERSWRWMRRHPAQAGFAAAALVSLLAIVGVAVALVYQGQLQSANRQLASINNKLEVALAEAETAKILAEKAHDAEARAKQTVDQLLYFRQVSLALAQWQDNEIVGARKRLNDFCPAEHRHWEWHYVNRLCNAEIHTFTEHANSVTNVAFSPDGKKLAGRAQRGALIVWDLVARQPIQTEKVPKFSDPRVATSSDGTRVANTDGGKTVTLRDAATGRLIHDLEGDTRQIQCLAFSPNSKWLAGGSGDNFHRRTKPGEIRIWDARTGKSLRTLKGHTGYISQVAFSPDGKQLASAGADKMIKIWNVATGKEVVTLRGHSAGVNGVAFSPDGKQLASAGDDKTVIVWRPDFARENHTIQSYAKPVRDLAFSPDGKLLASSHADQVTVFESATSRTLFTKSGKNLVNAVAFSPDGKQLAAAFHDKTLRVWETASGREIVTCQGHSQRVYGIDFSPDGKRIASASADGTAKVWNAATGNEIYTCKEHSRILKCVAFSPDGEQFASAGYDNAVKLWNSDKGDRLRTLRGHSKVVLHIAYDPRGNHLASASADGTVKVWNVLDGRTLHTLRAPVGKVAGVGFSPDGKRLANANSDGTVRIWDMSSGQEILSLKGHVSSVTVVTFSPDGKRLASGGTDGTVKIWEAPTFK